MKLLILTAFIAAVSTTQLSWNQDQDSQQSPWQVGKQYRYDVHSQTLARLHEGASSGSAFRAHFIVRVKAPGQLQARLEKPEHAQVHQELANNRELPQDLKYQPVINLDKPFEISLNGGRVVSLNLPSSLSLPHENLLKGLIGALQVDLSTYHNIHGSQDNYDKDSQQGLFRKMEADVTGDCETLYAVSPVAAEWRRELPNFASEEDPIEITKSKNYGHCDHRVAYHFGVPEGAEWTGTAHDLEEEQFIRRATVSRILASKQGQIYKSETTSTVHVHPHLFGKQKAEVYSSVQLNLESLEQDSEAEWEKPEANRVIKSLLYSMSAKQQAYHDRSSSSSSESHEHMQSPNQEQHDRVRRSAKNPKPLSVNQFNDKRSSSESSSSSSSDSSSAYVNDEIPMINEPAYAALYMQPQPHADKKQNIMNAQKLLQDIAQQMQNPNNMPKADFLAKFNILVRVISAMSTAQLGQTSRSIEVAKSSNNIIKADMWMIYRDAVAQAGTLPAFQQIKTWIQTKKVQGEEAAQIVATLANTLRYPTKEVMSQFYKLAVSDEVAQQRFLNTSALISATKFINQGQVNNYTAHSFYPVHMYGRLARKHDNFVVDEILPELSENLKNAVQSGDSGKAQVYIKAIGNLGHREILKVYAPYLEGKISTTTYLRVQIVSSLRVLAQQRDKQARAVLYSILRNRAETYEVRVAAIDAIFMTHPTAAMMQAMAQMTHNDPSVHVRSFLKFAIESASELKRPRNLDLARTAQAAKWMLTKEKFGHQHSMKVMKDNFDNEFEQDIFSSLAIIASEDSLYPKQSRYSLRNKNDGWTGQNMFLYSYSSAQKFVDYLKGLAFSSVTKSQANHKYSAEKIAQLLNIQRDNDKEPLEASIHMDFMNQQRFFTLNEDDLQRLPEVFKNYMAKESTGLEKHYTKVFNQALVSVMFPVAMGMPFIYKYKEPTVIHLQGKAKGAINFVSMEKGIQATLEKEIQITYARNIDGSVGFMDTLANQYSSVGVVNKLQLNLPIRLNIQMKHRDIQVKVQPLHPDQDTTLVHYSVWPYSASQKKESLVTISQDTSTKVIEGGLRKIISTDAKFGQKVGMVFQMQGYSYSKDFKNFFTMFPARSVLTNIVYAFNQRDVALTHFNFRHLGKQSQTKAVTFNGFYDLLHNQKQSGEIGEPKAMNDDTPNSEARRNEAVKRVAAGINSARVQVVDFSAIFEGPHKAEYILTAAVGQSNIDPKVQYVLFAGVNSPQGKNQVSAVGSVNKPEISTFNFLEALQKELKSSLNFDIKYGQGLNSRIQIQGDLKRSQKYTEELKNSAMGKQCAQEISENNYYQSACHKMIVLAHAPDNYQATVTYKNVDQPSLNMTYKVYQTIKNLGFWNSEVNPMKRSAEGKLEINVDAHYSQENYLTWSMTSKYGHIEVDNVKIPKWTPGVLSFYTPLKTFERFENYQTRHMYQPYCTLDGSKIRTFSNRTYDYTLTSSWHVAMQDQVNQRIDGHDIVILTRKPSENEQEIYISYKSETGKDLEIEIKPAQDSQKPRVQVKTNGQKISEGVLTMYWDDVAESHLLQYYTQPDGVLVLTIGENRLRVLYDGQRAVLLANHHRSSARGICGHMSGEPRDDYETPNGLVDKPEYYGASYALNDENADPKTQELQSQAKQQAYQPKNKFTSILRSDNEWTKNMQACVVWASQPVYRAKSYLKVKGPCQLHEQVQYYENQVEICISTTPLPSCLSHCRGEGHRVQNAQVTCRPKYDQEFQTFRNQIQRGENPQVGGYPQLKQYKVPTKCTA